MTEAEFLASDSPQAMLAWLTQGQPGREQNRIFAAPSDRKLRLFVHACVMPSTTHDAWLEDGLADSSLRDTGAEQAALWTQNAPTELRRIRADLLREIVGNPWRPVTPLYCACPTCLREGRLPVRQPWAANTKCPACEGTGKRPTVPWLTPLVLSLAQAAYDERGRKCEFCDGRGTYLALAGSHYTQDYYDKCPDCRGTGDETSDGTLCPERLAVLSDALEDAGCEDERCTHCHGSGTYTVQVQNAGLSAANGYGAATTYSEWRGCRHCGGDSDKKGTGRVPNPLLQHLRSGGPHARGCHVLDAFLGLE